MINEGPIKHPLGAGHMSDVDVAAFDPIFYLHHWYLPCPNANLI